jgi:hypothetical protein
MCTSAAQSVRCCQRRPTMTALYKLRDPYGRLAKSSSNDKLKQSSLRLQTLYKHAFSIGCDGALHSVQYWVHMSSLLFFLQSVGVFLFSFSL